MANILHIKHIRCGEMRYDWNVSIALQFLNFNKQNKQQTPWSESAGELCRQSDRRLSAKLVPIFADNGVSRSQRGGSPTTVVSVF
jgi:hypothetical protein